MGIVWAIFIGDPYHEYTPIFTKYLLQVSVIGIGFGTSFSTALELGFSSLILIIMFILLTMFLGILIGNILDIDKKTSHLISSGNAICGGSAIAAVSPTINANEKQTSISLGVVFILSGLALLVFPLVGKYFNLSQEQFGVWSGLAIHDTSSVLGAATDYGDKALSTATTLKMARVLFIIPLVIIESFLFKVNNHNYSFPYFILFFLLAMLSNSLLPDYSYIFNEIKLLSKKGLVVTLFLIGVSLSPNNLKSIGLKPFIHGFILWLIICMSSLFVVIFTI